MAENRIVYDCVDNPPPALAKIGSNILEMSANRIGPLDETVVHRAIEGAHEVYRTLKHRLGANSFMIKTGVLIQSRGRLYLDTPRLQDVVIACSRKRQPGAPSDPDTRLRVLRQKPFDGSNSSPRTTIGDLIRSKTKKESAPMDKAKPKPTFTKKQYVLFVTPGEAKAWATLLKLHDAKITLDCERNAAEISMANRLVLAGHMETCPTETADTMAFGFTTPPAAFHLVPIDERKERRVAKQWIDLIDRILNGEFKLPVQGPMIATFNEWARSIFPDIGKGSAYVMLSGFDPNRKYDHLGLIVASPDRQNQRSGEFLLGVRGFTAYDFTQQGLDSVQPMAPEAEKPAPQTQDKQPDGAMTRKSAEMVCVTLLGEEDMHGWSDQRIETYCAEMDQAIDKLTAHRKIVSAVHAQALERELKRLEDEEMERMVRIDQIRKRLEATRSVAEPAKETPST